MKKLYKIQLISSGNHRTVYIRADDMLQSVRMIQRKMSKIKITKIEPIGGGGHMMDQNVIILCPSMMQAEHAWKEFQKKYKSIIDKAQRHPMRCELFNGNTVYFRSEKFGAMTAQGVIEGRVVTMDDFEREEMTDER